MTSFEALGPSKTGDLLEIAGDGSGSGATQRFHGANLVGLKKWLGAEKLEKKRTNAVLDDCCIVV